MSIYFSSSFVLASPEMQRAGGEAAVARGGGDGADNLWPYGHIHDAVELLDIGYSDEQETYIMAFAIETSSAAIDSTRTREVAMIINNHLYAMSEQSLR